MVSRGHKKQIDATGWDELNLEYWTLKGLESRFLATVGSEIQLIVTMPLTPQCGPVRLLSERYSWAAERLCLGLRGLLASLPPPNSMFPGLEYFCKDLIGDATRRFARSER